MDKLSVTLCGVPLDNPVIPASGTFGYGYEFADYFDLDCLGSISVKGTTPEARYGNDLPRIAEAPSGVINSVGLQNPGVHAVIEEEWPKLTACFHKPIMVNVSGFSVHDYEEVCSAFDSVESVGWIELNISCPNVKHGGMAFGTSPKAAAEVVRAARRATKKPLITKLSPNVTDIAEMAKACENEGSDGISLINTLMAMRINLKTKKPILKNKTGGLSGPAIFPVALRCVWQVYEAVSIPIVGMGGVSTAEDVIEMMLAGATAVEIGAANLLSPYACPDIINQLPSVMNQYGIRSLKECIGGAHGE